MSIYKYLRKSKFFAFCKTIIHIVNILKLHLIIFYYLCFLKKGLNTTDSRENKINISLTTYPKRIKSASIVIARLLNQKLKPDNIYLYLSKEEFNNVKLPYLLQKEIKYGVQIIFCENLRSHKKYYFFLKENPNSLFITVDDDVFYPTTLVQSLYNSYLKFPNAVSCIISHEISFDNSNSFTTYDHWKNTDNYNKPSFRNLAIGVGGVLYPPNSLHKEVFNKESILNLCFNADDLWLKTMELMANVPVVQTTPFKLKYIPASQETSLFSSNGAKNENDVQIKKIFDKYNNFYGSKDTLISRMIKNKI